MAGAATFGGTVKLYSEANLASDGGVIGDHDYGSFNTAEASTEITRAGRSRFYEGSATRALVNLEYTAFRRRA